MFHTRWTRAALVLATTIAAAAAVSPSGAAAQGDVAFVGPVETGGTLRLILSADRSAIVGFDFHGVPFTRGGCKAVAVSQAGYFDPPLRVEGSEFEFSTGNIGTVHNPNGFTFRGTVVSPSQITGTVQQSGTLLCDQSPEYQWDLEGPIESPVGLGDAVYRGDVGGGSIEVTLDRSREAVAAIELDAIELPPCTTPDNLLDVSAWFDPALSVSSEAGEFSTRFVVVQQGQSAAWLTVEGALEDGNAIAGRLHFGRFFDPCGSEATWTATLASATPSPAPSATAVAGLPETGSGGARRDVSPLPLLVAGCVAFVALAAIRLRGA